MEKEKDIKVKFSTLYIDPIAMRRIMYYAEAADGEVSGLGTIKLDAKGHHIVSDVHLLDQESSGADTELKPEAISALMVDMVQKNQEPGELKFWWHSHANMGVFWSGTDDTCAETLSHEYAFSLVVNKAGDKKCRLDLYKPFRITIDNIRIEELKDEDNTLKEACAREVKEKVKTPGYKYSGRDWDDRDYDGYGGYGHDHWYGRKAIGFHGCAGNKADEKTRVNVPKHLVTDIETLVELAEDNATDGGILSPATWKEFIIKVLREVAEQRFEKKASCKSIFTFDDNYEDCKGKCKIKKACAYWTRFFDETEADAAGLIDGVEVVRDDNHGADIIIG